MQTLGYKSATGAILESPFRNSYDVSLDLHVWPLQTMNCCNSEQPVLFLRVVYEQMKILSSGMKIRQPKLTTDNTLKWTHLISSF